MSASGERADIQAPAAEWRKLVDSRLFSHSADAISKRSLQLKSILTSDACSRGLVGVPSRRLALRMVPSGASDILEGCEDQRNSSGNDILALRDYEVLLEQA
jgi:hypothetical protein